MRKRVFATCSILFIILSQSLFAQNKIGHINLSELMALMPETKLAQEKLKTYQDSLNALYNEMLLDYKDKDSILKVNIESWNKIKIELKQKELANLEQSILEFKQKATVIIQQKQDDLFIPVQKKAMDAVKSVGTANGYTYIINDEALFMSPPAEDILPLVKKALKIIDEPLKK